ncbi:MAG: trigger factor [Candidatus Omnitrophota bacterium]
MEVEIKKLDKLKRKIKVEVNGEEFLKERKEAYHQNSKNLKVPGFRPGTAPLEILEKHHGDFLKNEFLKKSLPIFYQKALEENNIVPAGNPDISGIEFKPQALFFSAEFEVKPEIEIKESIYKGIKIKSHKAEVKEIEIEKILTNLKEGIKKSLNKDLDDDNIAKWAAYPNAAELRESIKAQLFLEKSRQRRQNIDSQVKEHLLKSVKVDLPEGEVQRHHRELVDRESYNLRVKGVSQEDIDKYKKDLESKLQEPAREDIKLFYILEAIARAESIEVNDSLGDAVLGLVLSQAKYE